MSDQDFFFDEDEQDEAKPAEKPARKPASGATTRPAAARSATAAAAGTQSVSMTVAALIGVVALLLGVIVGILIPAGGATPASSATGGASMSAPELSSEQLNSGALPEGHPPLDSMGEGEGEDLQMPPTGMESAEPTTTE